MNPSFMGARVHTKKYPFSRLTILVSGGGSCACKFLRIVFLSQTVLLKPVLDKQVNLPLINHSNAECTLKFNLS